MWRLLSGRLASRLLVPRTATDSPLSRFVLALACTDDAAGVDLVAPHTTRSLATTPSRRATPAPPSAKPPAVNVVRQAPPAAVPERILAAGGSFTKAKPTQLSASGARTQDAPAKGGAPCPERGPPWPRWPDARNVGAGGERGRVRARQRVVGRRRGGRSRSSTRVVALPRRAGLARA